MNKPEVYPKRGQSYTFEEITKLSLRDIPSLLFTYKGISGVIQNCHLTYEELLSVPGMKESVWTYERETHEWIPIFHFNTITEQRPITDLIDLEVYKPPFSAGDGKHWWATPKGFPREQYDCTNYKN